MAEPRAAEPQEAGRRFFHITSLPRGVLAAISSVCAALAVFLALPVSRPFFLEAVSRSQWDARLQNFHALTAGQIAAADTLPASRAIAVALASEAVLNHHADVLQFARLGLDLSRRGATQEPDNSWWLQSEAAFYTALSQPKPAMEAWRAAASKPRWDDHQSDWFLSRFPSDAGAPAYVYAVVKDLQSPASSQLIKNSAAALYAYCAESKLDVLSFRCATLTNGGLMRKGAKSIAVMMNGIELSDSVLFPPNSIVPAGHHEMLIARLQLEEQIQQAGISMPMPADTVFRENDAEAALTSSTDPKAEFLQLSRRAAAAASLPGALLLAAFPAALLLILAAAFRACFTFIRDRLTASGVFVALIAVAAGFLVPLAPALTLILSAMFGTFSPKNARSRPPDDLGPLFRFTMLLFGVGWTAVGAWLFVMLSPPGRWLLIETDRSPVYRAAGAWALLASGLLVCGPLWAYAQRVRTHAVLFRAASLTAASACWSAVVLAVILTPLCVYVNSTAGSRLQKIASNEPVYHLLKNDQP